jgi:hypothetical protein
MRSLASARRTGSPLTAYPGTNNNPPVQNSANIVKRMKKRTTAVRDEAASVL